MNRLTIQLTSLKSLLALIVFMLWSGVAAAAIDTYEFRDESSEALFRTMTDELRCPKCQNQNLADSNSPIAADMRREIHRLVEEGQSGDQIVDFMVARYGDFVRYRPKKDTSTAVLWYGPIILLVLGVVVVLIISRRRKSAGDPPASSAPDRERLKKLLGDDDQNRN